MQYTVKNLGVINNASFDIKPLTVFIGMNNSNKTWTAYCLYALASLLARTSITMLDVGMLDIGEQMNNFIDEEARNIYSAYQNLAKKSENEEVQINSSPTLTVELSRKKLLENLTYPIEVSIKSKAIGMLLAVPDEIVTQAKATLLLDRSEFEDVPVQRMKLTINARSNIDYEFYEGEQRLSSFGSRTIPDPNLDELDLMESAIQQAIRRLLFGCFKGTLVLPAERKALISQLPLTNYRQRFSNPTNTMPVPLQDFIDLITYAQLALSHKTFESQFSSFASLLEQKIIKGKVALRPATDETTKKEPAKRQYNQRLLHFSPSENVELRMHASASLVRSLAGLDVYLRSFCSRGDLIVVDEPEMNAHPEAQLALLELLAMLANNGITVLITTHSPYLLDHLNNLVEASKLPANAKDIYARKFKLGEKDAFLTQEKLAVYQFGSEGTVRDIFDRQEGIVDLSSFSDQSNYVSNLFSLLLEANRDEQSETED